MVKDCGGHDHDDDCECCPILSILSIFACCSCSKDDCESRKIWCIVAWFVVSLAVLFGFIILIIYLILHPSKPHYELDGTTVSNLTLSPDHYFLSVTVQITLTTSNPNDRVGIYYDKLDVYAVYKEQQITAPVLLPVSYMGHEDVAVWSPYLIGTDVPLTPGLAAALADDEAAGILLINVKVDGTLRWKVGSWVSAHYYIFVNCPAFLTVDNGNGVGPALYHFQQMSTCSVEV
ncbi:NDR1/HIN1-like protein 12 [Ananas comosus]|uniref:NDR1/HIN1-like protein 12 n=1 Tax=Ananas comosus TaxID=4615 RepID=A0A6P5EGZ9_ANACO|nr:NDR1/HIN1-like protein 12 [Ananas comosus]